MAIMMPKADSAVLGRRAEIVAALRAEGVPLTEGYQPIHRLPAFAEYARPCPIAEGLHDHRLFYFENCAWSPLPHQVKQMGNAFDKVFSSADIRRKDPVEG